MEVIWGNQLIYRSLWSNFDIIILCTFLMFPHWKCLYMSHIFLATPVNDSVIEEVAVDVKERISDISLALYTYQYVWGKLDYY